MLLNFIVGLDETKEHPKARAGNRKAYGCDVIVITTPWMPFKSRHPRVIVYTTREEAAKKSNEKRGFDVSGQFNPPVDWYRCRR